MSADKFEVAVVTQYQPGLPYPKRYGFARLVGRGRVHKTQVKRALVNPGEELFFHFNQGRLLTTIEDRIDFDETSVTKKGFPLKPREPQRGDSIVFIREENNPNRVERWAFYCSWLRLVTS